MGREYDGEEKVADYLGRVSWIPLREAGETMLFERLPPGPLRVLDLGCGDGRLLDLVLQHRPGSHGMAVDVSLPMLERARARFAETDRIEVVEHDLARSLPTTWGRFDAVVSSFAIHHLEDDRKRELYREVRGVLEDGGAFCNLEHVSSATPALHRRCVDAFGGIEDDSNILLDVETQLRWLRELGFHDVDCDWKWLELALLAGATA
ncbi:MAG TPA: class I SAM-dependent methyltransferase [Baekduia sp.]|nr:class I SAM-dependent methyltransferase [Baekduia sp.]